MSAPGNTLTITSKKAVTEDVLLTATKRKAAAKATASAVKAIIAGTKALVSAIATGGWVAVLILIIVLLLGGLLCMVGGGNSSTVSPVSAEVEAYEPVIRIYARQYGIEEYVELIKAVMMQESGYNARYPRETNGITDPELFYRERRTGIERLPAKRRGGEPSGHGAYQTGVAGV